MKTVIDLCVPGTETDAMMWYADSRQEIQSTLSWRLAERNRR